MTATVPDDAMLERLLKSSARHSYDPIIDVDWDAPIPDGMWAMRPERMSLYGTELWDSLTEEQQRTLSMHEVASICSVGIWFEVILMQMMLRDLYDDDPKSKHMQYALTEVADECRHSTMFGKAIDRFGVPAYGPPPAIFKLGRLFTKIVRGPSSYGAILVAEEILDSWQREMLSDDRIQPLVRMVSRIHVLEEARHMTFAREEVARMMPGLNKRQRALQQLQVAHVSAFVAKALINPGVYASVGIDPSVGRKTAWHNPNYIQTLNWMGEKPVAFLRDVGLITPRTEPIWRSGHLIA
ncbi:MAG TPA: diiron oxygenase [Marmoricola sp.]|jgi:hypothetical protein|nr:diiron oxygenase [Nocardioidaceae bacterium]HMY09955.1 diiron oxygenase [Marmoricola sp.]HRV68010.1 diiron oxygenase [Marmoricola sp.]